MLSRTGEYALQAMIYLARHPDEWPVSGRKIAEETGISRNYLSRILGNLVRTGLLDSSPGIRGGFRMVRPAQEIRLLDVVSPFESSRSFDRSSPCSDKLLNSNDPCAGHAPWERAERAYAGFLRETSLHELSSEAAERNENGSKTRNQSCMHKV